MIVMIILNGSIAYLGCHLEEPLQIAAISIRLGIDAYVSGVQNLLYFMFCLYFF